MRQAASIPLTSSQLMLLRHDGSTPRNYNNVLTVEFEEDAHIAIQDVEAALNQALRAQPAYRLRFSGPKSWFDKEPRSVMNHISAGDSNNLLTELGENSFNLSDGPLVRCLLSTEGNLVRALSVSAPHIIMDGTAQDLLVDNLGRGLSGTGVLPCPESQYEEYVRAAAFSESRALAEYQGQWRNLIRQWDIDRAHLDTSLNVRKEDQCKPEHATYRINAAMAADLAEFARSCSSRLLDLILAGYAFWLGDQTGHSRHAVRLIASIRDRQLPSFGGCLVNTIPLVLEITERGGNGVAAIARRKQGALQRRFLPYLDICRHLLLHDEEAIDLLEASTMITVRRPVVLAGPEGTALATVDRTIPPAWPRAPILLRILRDEGGITLNVETDHRLPESLHAKQITTGLVKVLSDMSLVREPRG